MTKKAWFSPVYDPQASSNFNEANEARPPLRIVCPVDAGDVPNESRLAAGIFATMLYPGASDEEVRARWGASNVLGLVFRAWRTGDTTLETAVLASEPIASRGQIFAVLEFIKHSSLAAVYERWQQGLIAGRVLQALVLMDIADPGTASLEQAFFLTEKFKQAKATSHLTKKVARSTIKAYWSKFRTVSPWWAAFGEFTGQLEDVTPTEDLQANSKHMGHIALESMLHEPGHIIVRATNYLRIAAQVVPKHSGSSVPVLPWYETWLPPLESIPPERPDFLDPGKAYTGPSEEAKAILSEYRDRRASNVVKVK